MKTQKRTRTYHIRMTEEEWTHLKRAADQQTKGKMAAYIRQELRAAEGGHTLEELRALDNIRYELYKIGVNLNQIAHAMNSRIYSQADKELVLQLSDEVREQIERLKEHI